MHDGEDFDRIRIGQPINHTVGKARELTFVDIARYLWIQLRAAAYSMEGIFENVQKPLLESRLSFLVKLCRLASFQLSVRMPPDVHQLYFCRSSAMTVSESTSLAVPRSISSLRR